jgi:ATP-binding cassette, subfamily C, bacterial
MEFKVENNKRRNGIQVMLGLIGLIKPMLGIMILAIIMGCIGNLMAISITILGCMGLMEVAGIYKGIALSTILILTVVLGIMRGPLRYAEQACNHYIAFKLLARIRHKVFASLRRLAPAKLEGEKKGNLISIITSDIELLEVFYAHTISPVMIAFIVSLIMSIFIGLKNVYLGMTAAFFYILVGVIIPVINSRLGQDTGLNYRKDFGELNTNVLDNLYGLEEILQYQQSADRLRVMNDKTDQLEKLNKKLKKSENIQRVITDIVILSAGLVMLATAYHFEKTGHITVADMVISVIAMMSSFGPSAALSALSNNLHHTLASGNRVLNLLEEKPVTEELLGGEAFCDSDINCEDITFAYPGSQRIILDKFSHSFKKNKIHGILGKSGCGKSTLLKLLMRFFAVDSGSISYGNLNVNSIKTSSLRDNIAYVTQETFLFQDTIGNNIKVAKEKATRQEVEEAAKKASIHDFITSLPKGYDTMLAELGDSISGGERQRIGLARAFLHNGNIILLDEPTSNIDSLNESVILNSIKKESNGKTIILVSHRKSTMGIAHEVVQF